MTNFINKLLFKIQKPPCIFVAGRGCFEAGKIIEKMLEKRFKMRGINDNGLPFLASGNDILLHIDSLIGENSAGETEFLVKNSSPFILLITHFGDIPQDKDYFEGKEEEMGKIKEIVRKLPQKSILVFNFDDGVVRRLKNETEVQSFSFGFGEGADFRASDLNVDESGTNFKINYAGNSVPLWLNKKFGKNEIYGALASICAGVINGMNLVEISQILKSMD